MRTANKGQSSGLDCSTGQYLARLKALSRSAIFDCSDIGFTVGPMIRVLPQRVCRHKARPATSVRQRFVGDADFSARDGHRFSQVSFLHLRSSASFANESELSRLRGVQFVRGKRDGRARSPHRAAAGPESQPCLLTSGFWILTPKFQLPLFRCWRTGQPGGGCAQNFYFDFVM